MQKALRLQQVQPSLTLAISARAAELKAKGIQIISFGAGEPDCNSPSAANEAAKAAIDAGQTKYTAVAGMPALRAAIAKWYSVEFGIETRSEEVLVGTGGKQILYNAIMAYVNPGDKVLIPTPYWLTYPAQVQLAQGEPIFLNCPEEQRFLLTASQLEQALEAHRPKLLILNSPSNPTGQAYDADELKALAAVLARHPEVLILWDNIYAHLCFDGFKHVELARVAPELKERIIVCGGFSKTFAMTGWRLGFAIAPEPAIKAMTTIQSHSTSNATSFAQAGALAALDVNHDFIEPLRKSFEKRRDLLLDAIAKIPGLSAIKPRGAFYVMLNASAYLGKSFQDKRIDDDLELAEFLIDEAHVATVPCTAFGMPKFLRLSYALSEKDIVEGMERIAQALRRLS